MKHNYYGHGATGYTLYDPVGIPHEVSEMISCVLLVDGDNVSMLRFGPYYPIKNWFDQFQASRKSAFMLTWDKSCGVDGADTMNRLISDPSYAKILYNEMGKTKNGNDI